jgi:hypothetical protein
VSELASSLPTIEITAPSPVLPSSSTWTSSAPRTSLLGDSSTSLLAAPLDADDLEGPHFLITAPGPYLHSPDVSDFEDDEEEEAYEADVSFESTGSVIFNEDNAEPGFDFDAIFEEREEADGQEDVDDSSPPPGPSRCLGVASPAHQQDGTTITAAAGQDGSVGLVRIELEPLDRSHRRWPSSAPILLPLDIALAPERITVGHTGPTAELTQDAPIQAALRSKAPPNRFWADSNFDWAQLDFSKLRDFDPAATCDEWAISGPEWKRFGEGCTLVWRSTWESEEQYLDYRWQQALGNQINLDGQRVYEVEPIGLWRCSDLPGMSLAEIKTAVRWIWEYEVLARHAEGRGCFCSLTWPDLARDIREGRGIDWL